MALADYQAVVIGAGPAGARCAALLAAAGRSVLLLDASSGKRPRLCGGLLNRRAQARLPAALPPSVLREPAGMELHCVDADNRLWLSHAPGYLNLDRDAFDAWLAGLAQDAGARFERQSRVGALRMDAGGVSLRLGAQVLRADCVVDATGASMLVRRLAGLPLPRRMLLVQAAARLDPPLRCMWALYRRCYSPFFAWAIPKGEACLLGAGLTQAAARNRQQPFLPAQTLDPLIGQLARDGYSAQLLEPPRGRLLTLPRGSAEVWFGHGRLWIAGEAAGLVSPFSGEGISRALASGEEAARAILAGEEPWQLYQRLSPLLGALDAACRRARLAARAPTRVLALAAWQLLARGAVKRHPWHGGRDRE